jgi:AraC-like DNA-binding protein
MTEIEVLNKLSVKDLVKVAPFKSQIRQTNPHKHHNYFELILLTSGTGTHTIDFHAYAINPPTLFTVRRDQIHHWNILSEPKGYVVIIKKSFIEKSLDRELYHLFDKISRFTCTPIHYTDYLEKLLELLSLECADSSSVNFIYLEGLLKALLSKIYESIAHEKSKVEHVPSNLLEQFKELLANEEVNMKQVAQYAEKLNTTPQNLNAVCRKFANQSASELIQSHILSEAKRLLIYTSKTIAEIAFQLQFTDASHFVKYFKKHEGQTPLQYRNS